MPDIPWPKVLAALVAVVAVGFALTLAITDEPTPNGGHKRTVSVTIGPKGDQKQIELSPQAQAVATTQAAEAKRGQDVAAEADLHESAPPAPADAKAAEQLQPPAQPDVPESVTDAAPYNAGCSSTFVRNQSSRGGAPVLLGVIHWTGSRNLAGTADGLGIVRWFDTPAAQASSQYVTDDEGHCWYTVPESAKAWTQAGFNPWSISVEIINQGVQPLFGAPAGRARVIKLMRGWHARWKIPYRRGAVSGCRVTRTGFLAHRDLGQCGGGHPDVGSFDLDGLIREAAQPATRRVTAGDRRDCKRVYAYRQRRHAHKPKTTAGTDAFRRELARVRSHGYKCVDGRVHHR